MTNLFKSLEYLREQFNQGLHKLLNHEKLGTFILVLANATQHESLFAELQAKLLEQFKFLKQSYKQALAQGDQLKVGLLSFLQKVTVGFENIKSTQQCTESHWRCQFNRIRSFLPCRIFSFYHTNKFFIL